MKSKSKNKRKLPRYWLGTRKPASLGYLPNFGIGNALFSSVKGEDITPETRALRNSTIPSALNKLMQGAQTPLSVISNMKGATSGAAGSAAVGLSQHANTIRLALSFAGVGDVGEAASTAIAAQAREAASKGAASVGKSALGTAGTALGAIGTLYGLTDMGFQIANAGEHRTARDMRNTLTTNTYTTPGGNLYTEYGGVDQQAELQYERAQRRSKDLNFTATSIGTGAAAGATIGALAGSSVPVLGTAIGAAGGLIVGGLGSLFGLFDNSEEIEKETKMLADVTSMLNRQSRANALNLDINKGFYDRDLAANGKRPVYTSKGVSNKKATAKVSNGEVIGNFEDGYVSRVPGEKNNKDTKYANLKNSDFVISNKFGLSDYAAATGDYVGALKMLDVLMKQYRNKAKNGKLPKFFMGIPPVTDVDTRSDTTRRGVHEGLIPYGAGNALAGEFPLLSIVDQIDRQTNMTRPDSPIYRPGLITGEAPNPTGKWTNILDILKARKAAAEAKKMSKMGQRALNDYLLEKDVIRSNRLLDAVLNEAEFKPRVSDSSSGFSSRKANGKKQFIPYKCGKMPKCANGWGDYALSTLPHLGSVLTNLYLYNRVKDAEEYAPTITTEAPAAQNAINQMMAERIEARPYLNRSLLNYNLAAWNARRTPGMGLGGRMVMLDSLARAKQAQDADTMLRIDEANRAQRNKGYEARINLDRFLAENNTKNAWMQHAYKQQAHGQKETWLAQYLKNMDQGLINAAGDALRTSQYHQAMDNQQRELDIWQSKVGLDYLDYLRRLHNMGNTASSTNNNTAYKLLNGEMLARIGGLI